MPFLKFRCTHLLLCLIIISGAILRFIYLTKQGLWYDELYTAAETDPSIPWQKLFYYLKYTDEHPPLFFIIERIFFTLFGYNDWVARFPSVLFGILGIWAMYRLGKEIYNEQLGLISALIMMVNPFSIAFSQEARSYTMVCFLTAISYSLFIRLSKSLKIRTAILYTTTASMLIYTHYFSFLVLFCQGILFFVLLLFHHRDKRRFFITYTICCLVIAASYLPWFSAIYKAAHLKFNFFYLPGLTFFIHYYYDYFGSSLYVFPFLALFPLIYLVNVFKRFRSQNNYIDDPLLFSFIFITVSCIFSFTVPYLWSLFYTPVLTSRYLMITIPLFIIMIAWAILLIKQQQFRVTILAAFIAISLVNNIYVKNLYFRVDKTQYRELTAFIASGNKNIAVINQLTAFQHNYYMKKYNYTGSVFQTKKELVLDSIIYKKAPQYNIDTFWMLVIFSDVPPADSTQIKLDSSFTCLRSCSYFSAAAKLYARKKFNAPVL